MSEATGDGTTGAGAPGGPRTRATVHEVVQLGTLHHVYGRPALDEYVRRLWERRHFIRADARGRVVGGSRGMVLGLGWLVLRPVLDGIAYFLIFGVVLGTRRDIPNFIGYLLIGIFLFQFTTRCLNVGAQSLLTGRNLVRAFTFPRAALPVASVLREVISFAPVLVVLVLLLLVLPPREEITWRWLLVPLVLAAQAAFSLGLALLAARMTARVPDLTHLISVLSRFWLYGSAVFFSYDQFLSDLPDVVAVLELNPMFVVLDMCRDLLLYGVTPDATSWVLLVGWSVLALVGGLVFFWRGEESYGSL